MITAAIARMLSDAMNTVVKTVTVLVLVSIWIFILSYMFGEIDKELSMQIIWFIAKIVLTVFVTLAVLFHFDKTRS